MTRIFWSALIVIHVLIAALCSSRAAEVHHERWEIKMSAPTTIRATEIDLRELLKLQVPEGVRAKDARYEATRLPQEGKLYRTRGWLHLAAREDDGDFHVQLSTSRTTQDFCFIVETPEPGLIMDEIERRLSAETRAFLDGLYGGRVPSKPTKLASPVCVIAEGPLFLDLAHLSKIGKDGRAGALPRGKLGCRSPTVAELHPASIRACP